MGITTQSFWPQATSRILRSEAKPLGGACVCNLFSLAFVLDFLLTLGTVLPLFYAIFYAAEDGAVDTIF